MISPRDLLRALAVAMLWTACLGEQPAHAQANLLHNASFENGTENWQVRTYGKKDTERRDEKQRHEGHNSFRIEQAEATDACEVGQRVNVKPDTRYRLSGWIKTENLATPAEVKAEPGKVGACLSVGSSNFRSQAMLATTDWTYVTVDFSSEKADTVNVGPRMWGRVTGTAWFADLSLVELSPDNAIAASPKMGEEGFTVLLDKDHTDGWGYLGKGDMTVQDGVATTSTNKENNQGLYWYKKSSFADFTLKLDFKVDSLAANSGILMRFPDPGTDYQVASNKGYEIDIFGEQTGDIIYHPPNAKSINLPPSKISPPVPGAWTECEITAVGQKITVKIDGQVVSDITSRIWADGYIGLQTNRGTVQFRNIRIRDLSPPPVVAQAHLPTPAAPLTTADLVKTYRNSLVFVTGTNGSGSGFLAKYATGSFLFTNAHVAAGVRGAAFKTLEGTEVKIGAASCAVGHDIFLLQATTNGQPLEIMKGVDENASIGDEVVVLGNSEGAGVINTLTGKIVGVGPNLVEVDAPFQPGNSGSPIIHLKSGKVIGVATYAVIRKYDAMTKEAAKEPVVRRLGYRLDSIKTWQPVNWQAFFAQAVEMEAIEKMTGDLASFLDGLGKKDTELNSHGNPIIKNRIDAWREARSKRLSPRDASMADQSLLSFLKVTCQSDVAAARSHITYDYFQRDLADQQKERDEISKVFDEIIQNLRK